MTHGLTQRMREKPVGTPPVTEPPPDPERPASATMLFKADPDAALTLTAANINTFIEQIAGLTSATFGGTKATRQLAVLDGLNVARGPCDQYVTANDANGKLDHYIPVATTGCIAGVFKPAANTDYIYKSRTVASVDIHMIDDAGTPKLYVQVRDQIGGLPMLSTACSLAAWHRFYIRWTTDTLYLSVNGAAETSVALGAVGGIANLSHRMDLLGSLDAGGTFTGDFAELCVVAAADIAALMAYYAFIYPSAG